ncbi:lipase family alpha/beta hydrolase [Actinomadura rayongensis]|uniref:Lipase n=1 Tax=Actinomadura rayongensis TaxID=1429076 RepID=A0A6I4WAZ5_9ACTN|nr:lipase [Actinomadura rayongensis]MXQ68089.1 lipase [Actinomadura rayongensis]
MRRRLAAVLAASALLVPLLAGRADAAPPSSGFNDYNCRPSAAHPEPVLLLHGLGGNGPGNFLTLGPFLMGEGYCVYAETYGEALPPIPVGGLVSVDASAKENAARIDKILAATGASKVDVIGHSEGGYLSLAIPKFLPGYAAKIEQVVALAPPTHGTTFAGLVTLAQQLGIMSQVNQVLTGAGCVACTQLTTGAPEIERLTSSAIVQPGVDYTVIASKSDELVTPTDTAFVREQGVTNTYVQDWCPSDGVGHIGLAYDGAVARYIANTLDPAHRKPVSCGYGLPF